MHSQLFVFKRLKKTLKGGIHRISNTKWYFRLIVQGHLHDDEERVKVGVITGRQRKL